MAKVTLVFAVLLIVPGLALYLGTGSRRSSLLIPTRIGVVLGVFGWLCGGLSGGRRKFFMRTKRTPPNDGTEAAGSDPPRRKTHLNKGWSQLRVLAAPHLDLLLIGLVLMTINCAASLVLPFTSKPLLDKVLSPQHARPELLPRIVALVVLAMIVRVAASYFLSQMFGKASQRLIAEMRCRVQRHVGLLSVAYYDGKPIGSLVARVMTDVECGRDVAKSAFVLVGSLLTAGLAFIYLLHRSVLITVTVFTVMGAFLFVLQSGFKVIRPIFRERGKINADVRGRLTESMGGVRVIKGYRAEEREAGVFAAGVERLLANTMRLITMVSVLSAAPATTLGLVYALVTWLGGQKVLNHTWTVGDYFSYNMFLAFLIAPVSQILNIGTQITEAVAGLDRTAELMAEPEENQASGRTVKLPPINGEVRFEDVEFAYEPEKPVLHGMNFSAEPGTVTALVGSSGSGKSTIISLLCAFHTPSKGRVLVDGVDLATVDLDTFRSQLGVVLQDSFLFEATLRENVLFSRPNATEEEFLFACRTARVDEYAENFPDAYDTIVGERGVKLSGGQRQRLSIARALLAKPRILVLDEATSSLDSQSEALVQSGLGQLMRGRTTFVIAHRLSTIRRADCILVVEHGRIVERGNHTELFALGGRYYDLYTRQHGLKSDLFVPPGEGDAVPA